MCVFIISPVPITKPLTSELIDTPVFYNLAPRPIKYRVSVPIPTYSLYIFFSTTVYSCPQKKQGVLQHPQHPLFPRPWDYLYLYYRKCSWRSALKSAKTVLFEFRYEFGIILKLIFCLLKSKSTKLFAITGWQVRFK